MMKSFYWIFVLLTLISAGVSARAQQNAKAAAKSSAGPAHASGDADVPDWRDLNSYDSELRGMLERYAEDWQSMLHLYRYASSTTRSERLKQFFTVWLKSTENVDFNALGQNAKIDWLLFRNHLQHQLQFLDFRYRQFRDIEPLLPFADTIARLEERRRRMESNDPEKTAGLINSVNHQISETQPTSRRNSSAASNRLKRP